MKRKTDGGKADKRQKNKQREEKNEGVENGQLGSIT